MIEFVFERNAMRLTICLLMLVYVAGCTGYNEAMAPKYPSEKELAEKAEIEENKKRFAAEAGQGKKKNKKKGEKEGIVGKFTTDVADFPKVMAEHPDYIEVESVFKASDPISTAGSAYISMTEKISKIAFEKSMQIYMVDHDKPPSYDEFIKMMNDNNLKYAMLSPYKMYAYDAARGQLVVLQHPEKKTIKK